MNHYREALTEVLIRLTDTADLQEAYIRQLGVGVDELALEFGDLFCLAGVKLEAGELLPHEVDALCLLDKALKDMSGPEKAELWTIDALHHRSEWASIRRGWARKAVLAMRYQSRILQSQEVDSIIHDLCADKLSLEDTIRFLDDDSSAMRFHAVESIGRMAKADERLLEHLVAAVRNPKNRVRLMGLISVAHVAVAVLLRVGTSKAKTLAEQLLAEWWDPVDRDDLLWYLRNEGVLVSRPSEP